MKTMTIAALIIIGCAATTYAQGVKPARPKSAAKKPAVKPQAKAAAKKASGTKASKPAAQVQVKPLYANNFEKAQPGKPPQDFLVLGGTFSVVKDGANTVLELPGEPMDTFGLLFGPTSNSNVAVRARFHGTAKGRRAPSFGVGLFGVTGYKLMVTPAKGALDLVKDEEVKASVPYEWKSGAWTVLRLQARQLKDGNWKIEGKAWSGSAAEPKTWTVTFQDKEAPTAGRSSLWGIPYADTPIRFDDLSISPLQP